MLQIRTTHLCSLYWTEVEEYLLTNDSIIIPIGAVEQHGPSCPLGTDTILAGYISDRVGEKVNVLVGPCIPIGDSLAHSAFPGTVSLRPSTLIEVMKDYLDSLYRVGFRRFLALGAHWDNHFPVAASFSEFSAGNDDVRFIVKDFWEFPAVQKLMAEQFGEGGGHADATDASLLMAIDESLVDTSRFVSEFPPVSYQVSPNLVRSLITSRGVIGSDQTKASSKAGQLLLEKIIDEYVSVVRQLSE